jgi:hypothetical protein
MPAAIGHLYRYSTSPPHHTTTYYLFATRNIPYRTFGGIDHPQIERCLFTVTTGAIFIASVAWCPPVSELLNATLGLKIAPVVAENKRRSIFALVVNWKF